MLPNQTLPALADLQELTKRANGGDKTALRYLRVILDSHPEIWNSLGDMYEYALTAVAKLVGGGDALRVESVLRKARQLEKELAGASPSMAERLSIQSVVLAYVQTMYVEAVHPMPEGASLPQAKFRLQLKDSAAHRFQHSLKTLAALKKLLPVEDAGEGSQSREKAAGGKGSINGRHNGNGQANGKHRKKRRSSETDPQPPNRIVPFLQEPVETT